MLGWEQAGQGGERKSPDVLLTLERPWEALQPLEASVLCKLSLALPTSRPIQDCPLCATVWLIRLGSPREEEA